MEGLFLFGLVLFGLFAISLRRRLYAILAALVAVAEALGGVKEALETRNRQEYERDKNFDRPGRKLDSF